MAIIDSKLAADDFRKKLESGYFNDKRILSQKEIDKIVGVEFEYETLTDEEIISLIEALNPNEVAENFNKESGE